MDCLKIELLENLTPEQIEAAYQFQKDRNILKEVVASIRRGNSGPYPKEQLLADAEFLKEAIGNYEFISFREDYVDYAVVDVLEHVIKHPAPLHRRIFIDMDGTIARFHKAADCLERMHQVGFFENLEPYDAFLEGLKSFMGSHPEIQFFILSSYDKKNDFIAEEKQRWLDKYFPEVQRENRIIVHLGIPKSQVAPGYVLTSYDYLIDDYNANLIEWESSGGTSVKAHNEINMKGTNGELWQKSVVHILDSPELIVEQLEKIIMGGEDHGSDQGLC